MKKIIKKLFLFLFLLTTILMQGCVNLPSDEDTKSDDKSNNEVTEPTCSYCLNLPTAPKIIHDELPSITPTKFDATTIEKQELMLVDGVYQYTFKFNLKNGNKSQVVVTEIDLTKANIAAGTAGNSTSALTPSSIYTQLLDYENANPDFKVIMATNGDFFGGKTPVNAFVKDSIIIKDSHNDKGIYDYTNLNADLPASMPMLFGISGTTAQIEPIIKNASVKDTIKSKLFYELSLTKENTTTTLQADIVFNDSNGSSSKINVITSVDTVGLALPGSKVLTIKKHITNQSRVHGEIVDIFTTLGNSFYSANEENFYVIIPENLNLDLAIGDILSYNVTSPDNTWKYYDTIIGCRQALVINGQIADTVAKENSNGALSTNIPRTAIGVMPNGNVAIFSVESLRYGKKSTDKNDPYGLSLPELAEFMRYYGVYSGANFDGGGSTQLISLNPNSNELNVVVRSSDYGTYNLKDTRSVINTLIVYVLEENND